MFEKHYVRVRDTETFYLLEHGQPLRPVHSPAEMHQIGILRIDVVSAERLEVLRERSASKVTSDSEAVEDPELIEDALDPEAEGE